jgi:hypothetical protein
MVGVGHGPAAATPCPATAASHAATAGRAACACAAAAVWSCCTSACAGGNATGTGGAAVHGGPGVARGLSAGGHRRNSLDRAERFKGSMVNASNHVPSTLVPATQLSHLGTLAPHELQRGAAPQRATTSVRLIPPFSLIHWN